MNALRRGPARDRRPGQLTHLPLRSMTAAVLSLAAVSCVDVGTGPGKGDRPLNPRLVAEGQEIFRFDTFGDDPYWTDTLRLHEVIASSVSPALALDVGLKVDVEALPDDVLDAIASGAVDLQDPQTTVTLLKLGAVVVVRGAVETIGGLDTVTSVGV